MLANAYSQYRLRLDQEIISQSGIDDFTFNNSNFRSTHLALKLLRRAIQNTPANDDSPLKLITMETTARYSARTEGDKDGPIARIAIYARLSRDPSGLSVNLTVGELLRRAWDANESITWRGALINRAIERIEVFPGIRKPFVKVDGVTMRFDKDRVKIIWRQKDGVSIPAA